MVMEPSMAKMDMRTIRHHWQTPPRGNGLYFIIQCPSPLGVIRGPCQPRQRAQVSTSAWKCGGATFL